MADPILASMSALTPALGGLTDPSAGATGPAAVKSVASQFEGLLLSQLMKDLKMSLGGEDDSPDGNDTGPLGDVLTSELGLALSRAGGFGLGSSLVGALLSQTGTTAAQAAATTEEASTFAPAVEAAPTDPAPLVTVSPVTSVAAPAVTASPVLATGRVSSAFGWRADPIDGSTKFHKGLDVAIPLGSTVYAPAAGRVAAVGPEPGYGLTVVVDHGNGVETRYAHLSSSAVRPGDSVVPGDVLARTGNSGRSTGPHLHFEVLENGQAVDPSGWVSSVVASPAAPPVVQPQGSR